MAALAETVDLPSDEEPEEVVVETPEESTDLSNTEVVTKYNESARILNATLSFITPLLVAGATPLAVMEQGEAALAGLMSTVYTGKKDGKPIQKGVAFPICLSVNERICNYSPLRTEEQTALVPGDFVKIDMGCHIDGYIAVTAHTVVVPDGDSPVAMPCPEAGDVAVACHTAMRVACALIKPGNKNSEVTKAVEKVAEAYGVKCVANVRMHQMKQFVIDGKKEIALAKPNPDKDEQKVEEVEFEANEVYAIDVCMSTGEGEGREGEDRCTVFKRNVETKYKLKKDTSRALFNEVNAKAGTMAFTTRMISEERTAKAGIIECRAHNLFSAYPVFNERSGAHVAHFKTTLMLLPGGNKAATGLPLPAYFTSDKALDEENAAILAAEEAAAAAKAAKAAAKKAKKKKAKK